MMSFIGDIYTLPWQNFLIYFTSLMRIAGQFMDIIPEMESNERGREPGIVTMTNGTYQWLSSNVN